MAASNDSHTDRILQANPWWNAALLASVDDTARLAQVRDFGADLVTSPLWALAPGSSTLRAGQFSVAMLLDASYRYAPAHHAELVRTLSGWRRVTGPSDVGRLWRALMPLFIGWTRRLGLRANSLDEVPKLLAEVNEVLPWEFACHGDSNEALLEIARAISAWRRGTAHLERYRLGAWHTATWTAQPKGLERLSRIMEHIDWRALFRDLVMVAALGGWRMGSFLAATEPPRAPPAPEAMDLIRVRPLAVEVADDDTKNSFGESRARGHKGRADDDPAPSRASPQGITDTDPSVELTTAVRARCGAAQSGITDTDPSATSPTPDTVTDTEAPLAVAPRVATEADFKSFITPSAREAETARPISDIEATCIMESTTTGLATPTQASSVDSQAKTWQDLAPVGSAQSYVDQIEKDWQASTQTTQRAWWRGVQRWSRERGRSADALLELAQAFEARPLWTLVSMELQRIGSSAAIRANQRGRFVLALVLDEFVRVRPLDLDALLDVLCPPDEEPLGFNHCAEFENAFALVFEGWARTLAQKRLAGAAVARQLNKFGEIVPWDDMSGLDEAARRKRQDEAIDFAFNAAGTSSSDIWRGVYWATIRVRNDEIHKQGHSLRGRVRPTELRLDMLLFHGLGALRFRMALARRGELGLTMPDISCI